MPLIRRRAGKHLDVQSLTSCFDGVTCVICKPKQLFNELADRKQMVAYTKLPHLLVLGFIKRQIMCE